MRTLWYKGLAKLRKTIEFGKKTLSLKNSSPGAKADFSVSVFAVWYLHIYEIIWNM